MALRITSNSASLVSQRHLGINQLQLQRSLERLSSGKRINRAADDAAGLAVSDSLRAQANGLLVANANAQDSINLIQTAEGGLIESTNILHRMRELAIQAANDTYSMDDRVKIQAELDQLKDGLTRIATTTQYNGRNLLDGSIGRSEPATNATSTITSNMTVGPSGSSSSLVTAVGTPYWGDGTPGPVTQGMAVTMKIVEGLNPGEIAIDVQGSDGTQFFIDDFNGPGGGGPFQNTSLGLNMNNNVAVQVTFGGATLTASDIGKEMTIQVSAGSAGTATDNALTFHIGANEGQIVKMGVGNHTAAAFDLESASVVGATEAEAHAGAQSLIGTVDAALKSVNITRARLGAMQNRLSHTIANNGVAAENMAASTSRIQDTDVAAESSMLTRQQILTQVGTAMLAQANMTSRNALTLLGG